MDRKKVLDILSIYKESWEKQDSKKILTIFTKDAIYHERVLKKPYIGHAQIEKYWRERICKAQSDIKFKLLHLYLDDNTAIAEWDAIFNHLEKQERIHIIEVAILEFEGEKIKSLREYWTSEVIGLITGQEKHEKNVNTG